MVKKNPTTIIKQNTTVVKKPKPQAPKQSTEDKIKDLKAQLQATLAKKNAQKQSLSLEKPQLKQQKPETPKVETFNKGEKVFHEKFGMGKVDQIVEMGSDAMYMVDFGDAGKKALDVKFSKLKRV